MKILVTGAHGLLGRALLAAAGEDVEVETCGRRENSVGPSYHKVALEDRDTVERLLQDTEPDWVVHTAAWTDVDGCEEEPERARQVNLGLVEILATACMSSSVRLVQLSTDYVFDGRDGPYSETDEPSPLSHYGRIKLESEGVVMASDPGSLVVRTLWLYGHAEGVRRNLVTWSLEALAQGAPLKIVNDQWGNPTFAPDAAHTILELCRQDCHGVFHLGGADFMTRLQLVEQVASMFGLEQATTAITPMTTAEAGQRALRPLRSGLNTNKVQSVLQRESLGFHHGLEALQADNVFRTEFERILTDVAG